MNRKRSNALILTLTFLLLASLACQGLGGANPGELSEETGAPQETIPAPVVESAGATEESAQTGGEYDGSWVGTNTVDDKEILFDVENNQVTSVALNYTGDANGCTYHGAVSKGVDTGGIDPVSIDSDGFSFVVSSVNDELTFAGTFTSTGEANGTLLINSSADGLCGAYEKEVTWTATKGSSADAEATEDTGGTVSETDTKAIVTQFFDAINAGDVDSAMDMVGENVMFNFGATNAQFGRDNLNAYLNSSGLTYQISDIESFGGGMSQFQATASDGTTYSFCTILLQDGEIISLSLQP